MVAEGRREAERLVEDARAEQARLVSEQEVVHQAHAYAMEVVEQAQAEAERMRLETDDYVDEKLAQFEVALGKTLAAVTRGRAKLARRAEPTGADQRVGDGGSGSAAGRDEDYDGYGGYPDARNASDASWDDGTYPERSRVEDGPGIRYS